MVINGKEVYELCLIPTERCNLRCVYCLVNKDRGHVMSYEVAKEAVDEMLAVPHVFDYYKVSFMGGEPFLNFPLIRNIYAYIQDTYNKKDVRFEIVTNGTLFNDEIRRWLLSVGSNVQLVLSADGKRSTHNINRSNSFDKIDFEFVRQLPHKRINMVITPQSLPSTLENILYLQSFGFPVRMFIEEGIRWHPEHLPQFEEVLMQLLDYYLSHPEIEPCNLLNNSLYLIVDDSVVLGCAQHEYSYSVSADGEKYACHRCMPFENYGDLHIPEEFINDLSSAKSVNDSCQNCVISKLCNSCPASIASMKGRPEAATRCQMFKLLYKAQAFFYLNLIIKNPSNPMITQYSKEQNKKMIHACELILRQIDPTKAF